MNPNANAHLYADVEHFFAFDSSADTPEFHFIPQTSLESSEAQMKQEGYMDQTIESSEDVNHEMYRDTSRNVQNIEAGQWTNLETLGKSEKANLSTKMTLEEPSYPTVSTNFTSTSQQESDDDDESIRDRSLNENLIASLISSKNSADKMWLEENPKFESFVDFGEDREAIVRAILGSEDSKVSQQNEKRNIPGLIFNRVKSLLLERSRLFDSIFDYLLELESGLIEDFMEHLNSLDSEARTWKSVEREINENTFYGDILLQCIDIFLSNDWEQEFQEWVSVNNRRLKKSRQVLIDGKEEFRKAFQTKIELKQE